MTYFREISKIFIQLYDIQVMHTQIYKKSLNIIWLDKKIISNHMKNSVY
ncbi:Uncharacterised protein [Weeksella virosa]|nr:Uncharacterised protein [Weeksella virosa]